MIHLLCLNWYSPTLRNSSFNTKLTNGLSSICRRLCFSRRQGCFHFKSCRSKWKKPLTPNPSLKLVKQPAFFLWWEWYQQNTKKGKPVGIQSDYGTLNFPVLEGYWVFTASISRATVLSNLQSGTTWHWFLSESPGRIAMSCTWGNKWPSETTVKQHEFGTRGCKVWCLMKLVKMVHFDSNTR